jgi:hypothetical protein
MIKVILYASLKLLKRLLKRVFKSTPFKYIKS